jgi:hypothetical protein
MIEDLTIKNVGSRRSLKNFEKDLISQGLLRIRSTSKKSAREINLPLKLFVYNLLVTAEASYDSKSGRQQTTGGKRRSAGDIFRICKYYYPECTLKEVILTLNELTYEQFDKRNVISSICSTINKRVYRADLWARKGTRYNDTSRDEFNLTIKGTEKLNNNN